MTRKKFFSSLIALVGVSLLPKINFLKEDSWAQDRWLALRDSEIWESLSIEELYLASKIGLK